ncbi:PLD nuclease N-terminal domain-containing protein [Thiohalomonas denitrificans]|uniref:PLD nuclease N-terminal domain-containing protein n=1 Tax=Thiohalomonas denitrificans TaxID=415747 RepID=UPI0026F1707E|nr:PLD nuclease N-terminal domain-containing protein [Thiohalomonas denitrificans]
MDVEVGGLLGLILLVLVVWAIVQTIQSRSSTGAKVLWIVFLLLVPAIGFIVWLITGPRSAKS